MIDRKELAQQLRDDAATILAKLQQDGESIAQRIRQAADLLDGRSEHGIEPLRYPDA